MAMVTSTGGSLAVTMMIVERRGDGGGEKEYMNNR